MELDMSKDISAEELRVDRPQRGPVDLTVLGREVVES